MHTDININRLPDMAGFFLAGISYQKTDAPARGWFAIDHQQYENCLNNAPSFGVSAVFILSTCNRTEIYGFAADPEHLISLLCSAARGSAAAFTQLAYVKKGEAAAAHLFRVGAGLDSQLLGDYEIVGQLKQAIKVSRDRGFINTFLDRLASAVLQVSRCIKNNTLLSSGTVSAAFAAVQYIKAAHPAASQRILVLGAGKMGSSVCKNLLDYLHADQVVVMNRLEEKAALIAALNGLTYAPLQQLAEQAALADIIIVCTHAPAPLLLSTHLAHGAPKLVIDLSVPANVEQAVSRLPYIQLAGIDEISRLNDQTLKDRMSAVPQANAIVAAQLDEFLHWCQVRKTVPLLKALPANLQLTEKRINAVAAGMAQKMRSDPHAGCHFIEVINELVLASG